MSDRGVTTRDPGLDVERVRADFPVLGRRVHGRPLVYLDSAASAQKPQAVIDAVARCYGEYYSNVHRGVHWLSEQATAAYEGARARVQQHLNARRPEEIVFVRGATEAINLVAATLGRQRVGAGDEVLVTTLEHHSNIVPWQMLCAERGARLRVVPISDAGELDLDACAALIGPRTRVFSFAHVSNALGSVNPVAELAALARERGVISVIDGAQAAPHLAIDVQALGCDFYALSGHKVYGPTGIGVLYGRHEQLRDMPPYQGGGDMIRQVRFEHTDYAEPPHRFEAGTPNIAGAIGLAAALDWLDGVGLEAVAGHEHALVEHALARLARVPGLRLVGRARERAAVVSFVIDGIHPHDMATVLDREGIAIRAGHHCAQPLLARLGLAATARASFGVYNTPGEIDALVAGLARVRELLG